MPTMRPWLIPVRRFVSDTAGQDLIEYALLGGLIGLAAVASMRVVANAINQAFIAIPTKAEAAFFSNYS